MKMTSYGSWPSMEVDLQWKMTSNGKWPQNIKSWISQQPLIGISSNIKLKLKRPNQNRKKLVMKMTSNGRQPENIKVEYLSNYWSHLPQIATLGLSWYFSLSEILASLCLQDRPQSGNIITEPASQPTSQPTAYFEKVLLRVIFFPEF